MYITNYGNERIVARNWAELSATIAARSSTSFDHIDAVGVRLTAEVDDLGIDLDTDFQQWEAY